MGRLEQDLTAIESMTAEQLKERWAQVDDRILPRVPIATIRLLVAHRLQERKHGGLPKLVQRELMRLANQGKGGVVPAQSQTPISPGARLVREWNGQTIVVEVLEEGFRYKDKVWNSLSEIARHITGTQWSGPRFFGLNRRG